RQPAQSVCGQRVEAPLISFRCFAALFPQIEIRIFGLSQRDRGQRTAAAEGPWRPTTLLQGLSQNASPSRISQTYPVLTPYISLLIADCGAQGNAPVIEVLSVIRKLISSRMSQHVRMNRKRQLR